MRKLFAVAAIAIVLVGCVGDDPPSTPADPGEGGVPPGSPPGTPPSGGASLAIAPLTLAFGVVAPGATSPPQKVTITNKGTAPSAALEASAITGLQASSFAVTSNDCQAKTLQIADACTMDVVYKPVVEGPASATLAVGTLTTTLSGTSSLFVPEDADHTAMNGLNAVWAVDSSHVYAVGQNGRVVFSADGATWNPIATPAGSAELRTVQSTASGYVFIGGKGPILMRQAPLATGFTAVTLPTTSPMTAIHALWATPPGAIQKQIYVVGEGGRWISMLESATPASTINAGPTTAIYGVNGHYNPSGGGDEGFCAGGANGTTFSFASAAGNTLTATNYGSAISFQGMWTDGIKVVAVTNQGVIMRGTCGALVQEASFTGVSLNGIWGTSNVDLWAVGSGGAIYHSTAAGTWTKVESGTTKDLRGIHGTATSNLYVVGDGVILHKKQ